MPVVGLKHRYGYMMANAAASAFEEPLSANGAILKYDLDTGAREQVDVGIGPPPGRIVVRAEGRRNGARTTAI